MNCQAAELLRDILSWSLGLAHLAAPEGGVVSVLGQQRRMGAALDDACDRYKLTNEEFLNWQQTIDRYGMPGLRTTRIQQYR